MRRPKQLDDLRDSMTRMARQLDQQRQRIAGVDGLNVADVIAAADVLAHEVKTIRYELAGGAAAPQRPA